MVAVVGFTGTRVGMTSAQKDTVYALLKNFHPLMIVHGGCEGADTDLDAMAYHLNITRRIRPSDMPETHGQLSPQGRFDELYPARPPLTRNRSIVADSSLIIACPETAREEIRSGTWATVRYTRAAEKPLYIVWPNGTVTTERI